MLKINLLPVRQLKRMAKARKEIALGICIFIVLLAILAAVGFRQVQKISSLHNKQQQLTAEKASYDATLRKIEKLKKAKQELARKAEVIDKLRADASLTVRLIDEVANRIDNKRMWLTSMQQQGSSLKLSGVALDNQTIAQFMDKLKESPFVTGVTLSSSSLKVISGKSLKSYQLACSVAYPVAEKQENPRVQ
ncbi:MAG: pilus assembly protein PilN [Deltaproteobacteria bacterium]|nr:MAG: pilus assembly protein PilN [Deltaproteobacteria bacterium]